MILIMLDQKYGEDIRIEKKFGLNFVKTFEAKSSKAEVTDSSQLSQLDKSDLTTEQAEVAEEKTDVMDGSQSLARSSAT